MIALMIKTLIYTQISLAIVGEFLWEISIVLVALVMGYFKTIDGRIKETRFQDILISKVHEEAKLLTIEIKIATQVFFIKR